MAAWTFAGKWDPERRAGPAIRKVTEQNGRFEVVFSESVTVKGKPQLIMKPTGVADYISGGGTDTLRFAVPSGQDAVPIEINLRGGAIIATEASASLRSANLSLPLITIQGAANKYEP
jgi:hypothetical protein